MLGRYKILALIPARSGSKRVKDKNIKIVNNKPLIFYTIKHALNLKIFDKIIVSTDSIKYKKISEICGAEVPFLRPKSISRDKSDDLELFLHAITWLKKNNNFVPNICVHLRPTSPIRDKKDSLKAIKLLSNNKNIDSLRSISPVKKLDLFKIYKFKTNKLIDSVIIDKKNFSSDYRKNKQSIFDNNFFFHNGNIDVLWTKTILKKKSMSGTKIRGFITSTEPLDINKKSDFNLIRKKFIY